MRSHLVKCRECLTLSWAPGESLLGMPGQERVLGIRRLLLKVHPVYIEHVFCNVIYTCSKLLLPTLRSLLVGCRVQGRLSWEARDETHRLVYLAEFCPA